MSRVAVGEPEPMTTARTGLQVDDSMAGKAALGDFLAAGTPDAFALLAWMAAGWRGSDGELPSHG